MKGELPGKQLSSKTACDEMTTFFAAGSQNFQALVPSGYPMKMHLRVCDCSAFRSFLRQHLGQAAKNAEIGHIWLPPIALPSGVGYATIQCSCGHAISRVDKGRDGVHPERRRELGLG